LQPTRSNSVTLVDLVDRILDKGLVINADITVSIAGIELLGIKIRAALASFETAARYGLEFPSGSRLLTQPPPENNSAAETAPTVMDIDASAYSELKGDSIVGSSFETTPWDYNI